MEKIFIKQIISSLKEEQSPCSQNVLVKVSKNKSMPLLINQFSNLLDRKQKTINKTKKKLQRAIAIPIKCLNSNEYQFQIIGGFYININLLTQDTPMRLSFSVIKSEYFKESGILILDQKPREKSIRDVKSITKIIKSIHYQNFGAIAQSLEDLQPQINQNLLDYEKYVKTIDQQMLKDTYEELYQQFEDWAIQYVKSMNGLSEFFSFYILKFDLPTLETSTMKVGYSSAFLELRGTSWEKEGTSFSKNLFSFFTKETVMSYIMKVTKTTIYGKIDMEKPCILTLDNIRIPFTAEGINISNRSPQYPNFNNQSIPKNKIPEFQLNIRKYIIDLSELEKVLNIRQSRLELDHLGLTEDFSFSTVAFEYIYKFYQDHKYLPCLKGYHCGGICCHYKKTDVFLMKN